MTTKNILFLCTGNSARSIIAECVMNHLGGDAFRALSAGSHPTGRVHPVALDVLTDHGYPTEGAASKSWDRFAQPSRLQIDIVITVCGNAADEVCPVWPGAPLTAHWGLPDPAALTGDATAIRQAFEDTLRAFEKRIGRFLEAVAKEPDQAQLAGILEEIGQPHVLD
ncbi:MAG: arsenate reductase ArsC [Sphingomonadales bacterium]